MDAVCIGCGCSEFDPCIIPLRSGSSTCYWVAVDRRVGRGVCSADECRGEPLQRWDRGERELSTKATQHLADKARG